MEPQFKSSAGLSAFLFTDIEGSSVRWLNHRAAMEKAVARHDAIVRRIVSEHGGKIFKSAGDAFYAAFARPADAANASIALQRAFLAEDFTDVEGLRVRMAVHFGSAEKRGKDFFGPALNRTARLLDLAHGGQILVTASTAEVIQAERDVGATFVKVGASPLDDPAQVVDVHQLVAPDLPRDFPPLRRPKAPSARGAAGRPSAAPDRSGRWMIALGVLSVLVALAALLQSRRGDRQRRRRRRLRRRCRCPSAPAIPEKSVAVLPFDNLSEDKENAFFTNGMQDEILTDLARVADLKVISRSSVMHYKTGVERNVREIGRALGVAYVLEGSVQRSGGKVRVTAQLIDTRSDAHVWAQRYDRDLADAFAIQSEVAEAIAAQLRAKISPAEKVAMTQPPTKDLVAYDHYRRALSVKDSTRSSVNDKETLEEAVRLFDAAVARDPTFLVAYAQLAQTHDLIYWFNYDHSDARLALAEAAVRAAENLNPDAGESKLARGVHSYWGRRDLGAARRELEAARRLLPNNPQVASFLGLIDRREGRWDDAVQNLRRASELDPRDRSFIFNRWTTYIALRKYADAAEVIRQNAEVLGAQSTRFMLGNTELLWKANMKPLRESFTAVAALGPGGARDVSGGSFDLAVLERDPVAAAQALEAIPETGFTDQEGFPSPRAWFVGRLARMRGDAPAAEAAFKLARADLEQVLQTQGETAPALNRLATIDAYLGRRDDAIRSAQRACDLVPLSRDKIDAPRYLHEAAAVYAILGEKDPALEILAVAAANPGWTTYGELRLNPDWDSLRGDSRFEVILAKLAPKEPPK